MSLDFDQVLAHLVRFLLFVATVAFKPLIALRVCLGLFHASFHILDKLCQLPIFVVFLLERDRNVTVLLLHLSDHSIPLLEFLLDYFEFLWVCKRILGTNDFFKLMSHASALFHVKFHLNFHFLLSCASDVSFESLNLVTAPLILVLQVFNLSLQIDYEVRV